MSLPGSMGILPVDKPEGPTSHDIVARARKALDVGRIGHTGTLDPFASGLLLLCVGKATRLAEYLTGLEKAYEARARLGRVTETDDPEGEVVRESDGWRKLSRDDVEEALEGFRGTVEQLPPRFSAKKIGGEPAHRRARRGEDVRPVAVEVEIRELTLSAWDPPWASFRIACSPGTYVRALARDIGEALGCGAHLAELRRTRIGARRIEDAVPADRLGDPEAVADAWLSPTRALAHLARVEVDADAVARLAHGRSVELPSGPGTGPEEPVLAVESDELVAVCTGARGWLRPRKVFVEAPTP